MDAYKELFDAYSKLGTKDKRIAYLKEVKEIELLLNELLLNNNIEPLEKIVENESIQENMKEKDFLDISYKKVYLIKILLIQLINDK